MYTPPILQILAIALCASPIASALAIPASLETRDVGNLSGDLIARHHTEAQIAAKAGTTTAATNTTTAASGKKTKGKGKAAARDLEEIEARHHTEAQIAAKKAKASKSGRDVEIEERVPHHTEAQIAAKKAKAAKSGRDVGDSELNPSAPKE